MSYPLFLGSTHFLVGLVSCLWPPARFHDLQEEVFGIMEPVGLASDGLDEIVGSLQSSRTDRMVGMIENAFQMGIDHGGVSGKMFLPAYDTNDFLSHSSDLFHPCVTDLFH